DVVPLGQGAGLQAAQTIGAAAGEPFLARAGDAFQAAIVAQALLEGAIQLPDMLAHLALAHLPVDLVGGEAAIALVDKDALELLALLSLLQAQQPVLAFCAQRQRTEQCADQQAWNEAHATPCQRFSRLAARAWGRFCLGTWPSSRSCCRTWSIRR